MLGDGGGGSDATSDMRTVRFETPVRLSAFHYPHVTPTLAPCQNVQEEEMPIIYGFSHFTPNERARQAPKQAVFGL